MPRHTASKSIRLWERQYRRWGALSIALGVLTACAPNYRTMGDAVTESRVEENVFIARDGVRLPLSVWGPRTNPDKIVIAVHSFGEFRDAFALLGDHLAGQNISVWAYDQRGFGDAPHPGMWAGKDTLITDFQDFVRAVQDQTGQSIPLFILGESMGAAVVLAAIAEGTLPNPEGIVLSGPGVREDRPWRYWFNAGLWVVTRVRPGYEAEVPREYDSRLAEYHATRWAEDPRIIDRVRLDTYFGLIRLSDLASEAASAVNVPTLVLFGTEDSQIHPNSICALMNRLGQHGTLQRFEGKPHLMFQIKDQETVQDLVDQWLVNPGRELGSDSSAMCEG